MNLSKLVPLCPVSNSFSDAPCISVSPDWHMRAPKWIVVAKTTPMDAQAAREQARWLKLGDDALLNRSHPEGTVVDNLLQPGIRALGQFESIARELRRTVRKYRK